MSAPKSNAALQSPAGQAKDKASTMPALAWRSGARPNFHVQRGSTTRSDVKKQQNPDRPQEKLTNNTSSRSSNTGKEMLRFASDTSTRDARMGHTRYNLRKDQNKGKEGQTSLLTPTPSPPKALKVATWWREGPMPRRLRDYLEVRPVADPRSLQGGCMIWVPTKEIVGVPLYCIREGHPCGGEQLNDSGFDHPGVILAVFKEADESGEEVTYCTIAQLRTFKRTSCKTYSAGAGQQFRESVPIRYPEEGCAEGRLGKDMEQLDLACGELFNQTYIQLQHIFKVPASKTLVFHFGSRLATDVRLTDASYVRLMHLFGYMEKMGPDGSVPNFGPSPPPNAKMQGYYGSNFVKSSNSTASSEAEF